MEQNLTPNSNKLSFWTLLYSVLGFTAFQFIPVYFTQQTPRLIYYCILFLAFAFSSVIQLQRYFSRSAHYLITKILSAIFLIAVWMIALLFVLTIPLAVWSEAGTYYVNKNDPEVKIISRYLDLGAFGGGTEPGDYEIVWHRPVTPYFKIEMAIDTNKLDKKNWLRR
ncbi:hypothetical protein [Mucilaginibacter pedocola]|uniref:Uncharacterized protein n=1 Tax=Mucilaginibacter pedocola TaxID=1792845 RepID=A0A1S9PC56_9SPHI|nr:hypothetical protein [Mucilaginibacter pedocola]OOQ58563.1 hypothetical protein BC343_07810 [Mucilaginibacter pedocola]